VVERVHGAERELDIALRINVVESFERDVANILHIDIFIHNDDAFGEHRLPQRPDGVHYFARLPRVRFFYRHNHQVVEDTLDR